MSTGLIMANLIIVGAALKFEDWNIHFGASFMLLAWYLYISNLIHKNPGAAQKTIITKCGGGTLIYVGIPFVMFMLLTENLIDRETLAKVILFPAGATLFLVQAFRCRKWFLKRWAEFKPVE